MNPSQSRRGSTIVGGGLVAVLVAAAAPTVWAQGNQTLTSEPHIARLISRNVELLGARTGRVRRIYTSNAHATTDISISPSGHMVALVEATEGVVEGHNYRIPPRNALVVLDTMGGRIIRFDGDVRRYAWLGDSRIAFVSGVYTETEKEFEVTGAGILDLRTGSVDSLPGRPRELAWASFDGALYLAYPVGLSFRIDRYDPSTRSVTPTGHKGLRFSEDGQYYLTLTEWMEGSPPPVITRTIDDTPVSRPDLEILGSSVRWLPSGASHLLVLVRKVSGPPRIARTPQERGRLGFTLNAPGRSEAHDYIVYDVSAGRIVHRLHAEFPAWGASDRAVPLRLGGGRVDAIARP